MALVSSKEMFEKAYKGGYAIGAFNVNNMEIVQGLPKRQKKWTRPDSPGLQRCPRLCKPYLSHQTGGSSRN